MTAELDALREVSFDWTRSLRSVWRDAPYHVPTLNDERLDDIIDYFERRTRDADPDDEPLGRVIVGAAGFGKTHLIGQLRGRVWARHGWFILLDLVGVKDFWSSVALGFLNSLQTSQYDDKTQYDQLLLRLAGLLRIEQDIRAIAADLGPGTHAFITALIDLFANALARRFPQDLRQHRNVVAALVLLSSDDPAQYNLAHGWLQGTNLDPHEAKLAGFIGDNDPLKVVRGLSWLMSVAGPTMIAVDQIDAIVTAANSRARAGGDGMTEEQIEARSIVDSLAQGLMDLHEAKRRAVTVVSCLEATWRVLEDSSTVSVTDRYSPPVVLQPLPHGAAAKALVEGRLSHAFAEIGFTPPHPTWPFADAAFESGAGLSPRSLLKACDEHRLACLKQKRVTECVTFDKTAAVATPQLPPSSDLDRLYADELSVAAADGLMSLEREDELRELFQETLHLFAKHLDLPDDIDVAVQPDPDQKRPALHGRLSFTFRSEGDREQHFCFRVLGHTNALAFQSRLKAATTAAGIDTALKFRHLMILRRDEPPRGAVTTRLVEQFMKAGGQFVGPSDEELRVFIALRALSQRQLPEFESWLRDRKPLFQTALFKAAGLSPPAFLGPAWELPSEPAAPRQEPAPRPPSEAASPMTAVKEADPPAATVGRHIPIGRRVGHGVAGALATLPADLLSRHVAILAGSGSGKTVLLRRMVEEAALLGIPSIVLDVNNDLARLGDSWPERPAGFSSEDEAKAAAYQAQAEVVIWTPGVSSGNPVSLNLLPNFGAIGDGSDPGTEDERNQAIEMARATLLPYAGGSGQKAQLRAGVLAEALRRFAMRGGGTLDDLIRLLADLPEDTSQIGNAQKLAGEMADQLRAAVATDPLLRSGGATLDPQRLFNGDDTTRTRISVINLACLASDEAKQAFVNRLQMTLFTWVKQNPSPTGRLYVLDEAQNFAPAQAGTACKASTKSLVAQARKYGLGMVFATQLPRGIDNAIVSNCTTHVYGRMSSPATIQATQELMAAKGGAADDIARLTRGEFYFSTDGLDRPVKIHTPLCLSWHPPNPPTAEEVVARAHAQRSA